MVRILRRFALFLSIIAFASVEPGVAANPVGEFFKRVGRSISSLGKSPTPTPTPRRPREGTRRGETVADKKDMPNPPSAMPFVTPTPTPMEVRPGHGCSTRRPAITRSALRRGGPESARVGDQSLRAQSRVGGCACISQVHGSHGPLHGQGLPHPLTASFTGSARLYFWGPLRSEARRRRPDSCYSVLATE